MTDKSLAQTQIVFGPVKKTQLPSLLERRLVSD